MGPPADWPWFLLVPSSDPDHAAYRFARREMARCPYGDPWPVPVERLPCGSSRHCHRLARKVAPSECVICVST